MRDTATNLADRGWDVTVLAPPPCFPHGEFDRTWARSEHNLNDGVDIRRLWAWQPAAPDPGVSSRLAYYISFALHALAWLIRRNCYDLVLTTTPPISTGVAGLPVALAGTPWVVDVRDLWIDASVSLGFIASGGILERSSRLFQRLVLHTADRISVTTTTLGESLCDQYGASLSEKIVLVPNGVDMSQFSIDTEPEGESLPSAEVPVIVYVGNIGHAQELEACIRALGHLSTDAVLRLVGGGDQVPELERLVSELGLGARVQFVGPVPREQVPAILAGADVGLAPLAPDEELSYAMPTKVYEYLGAGLPAVVTGNGELKRFIRDSGGGIHTDADPTSIADALDELLSDPDLRAEMGRRGHQYVRTDYARAAIVDRFENQLRATAAEGASRAG